MAGQKSDGELALLIVAVIAILALGWSRDWRAQARLKHGMSAWSETPQTAAGALLARARDLMDPATWEGLTERAALNWMIRLMNKGRPYTWMFLAVCLGIFAYQPLARHVGSARYWQRPALFAAAGATASAGSGALATLPLTWPVAVIAILGALAMINVVSALGLLLLAAVQPSDTGEKLRHGPKFCRPRVESAAITVGATDPKILPGHARWLAREGGSIDIPFDRLSCGVTILGEKGSGKSRLLFAIHDAIRARYPSVPILIHDPKGEWYRTYYDPAKDLYFAPHFEGSAAWSLWDDFRNTPALRHELIASTVHAHPDPSGSFWMDQAVEMLKSAIADDDFGEAVRYLSRFPREHHDDKFALSVFGTARLGFVDLAKVQLMAKQRGLLDPKARSIDDFLSWPGRIFLLNDPSCESEQHGAFSLFLSAFLLRALSMPDVPAGTLRAVAIIDEALTFSLPPSVDRRIYALCRSKGICIITGAQRLPDHRRHEQGEWETAEHTFAMKVVNQETQAALSKRAGSLIFKQPQTTTSKHADAKASKTEGEHESRLEALPPEHLGRLAPREFVLFHDRGLVTGRTVDVRREQREIEMPFFDARTDVQKLSAQLLGKR